MNVTINKKFNSYANNPHDFLSDGYNSISFCKFFKEVQKQTFELKQLNKKSVIFVIADNTFRYWINFISIVFSGSIFVPLPSDITKNQIEDYMKVIQPDFLIAEDFFFSRFENLKKYQLKLSASKKRNQLV